MALTDSILTTIRGMLGPSDDYEHFDTDIIVHINTALMSLNQMGVGPAKGLIVTGTTETWAQLVPESATVLTMEGVKSYIYFKVKLGFDSNSLPSSVIESFKSQITELEWRLTEQAEELRLQ